MFRGLLLGATVLAGMAGAAQAATITFTSNGGFSNISGCGDASSGNGCQIRQGGNLLDMSGSNNSTLLANDISTPQSFNTDAANVALASITWENNASQGTDQDFNVRYNLTLSFTAPNANTADQTFNLRIQQPTNPPGDIVSGLTSLLVSGLLGEISLNGVTVSNLRWEETGGGAFSNGVWTNPEFTTSVLTLRGDFRATPAPEPMSLALFGIGLAGLGFAGRRKAA